MRFIFLVFITLFLFSCKQRETTIKQMPLFESPSQNQRHIYFKTIHLDLEHKTFRKKEPILHGRITHFELGNEGEVTIQVEKDQNLPSPQKSNISFFLGDIYKAQHFIEVLHDTRFHLDVIRFTGFPSTTPFIIASPEYLMWPTKYQLLQRLEDALVEKTKTKLQDFKLDNHLLSIAAWGYPTNSGYEKHWTHGLLLSLLQLKEIPKEKMTLHQRVLEIKKEIQLGAKEQDQTRFYPEGLIHRERLNQTYYNCCIPVP